MEWSLRRRIAEFLKRTGMSPTRLGLASTGDPQLIFQIRKGRKPRRLTAAKLRAYMDRVESGLEEPRPRYRAGSSRRRRTR